MKKLYLSGFALILSVLMLYQDVYAHNYDYYDGTYSSSTTYDQSNMYFYVESSAITAQLPSSIYTSAYDWNGISDNVHISAVVIYQTGMPSYPSYFHVRGNSGLDSNTLAITYAYNQYGNIASNDANWKYVAIEMNTNSTYSSQEKAKGLFRHEVGHALKLKHPSSSPTHNSDGSAGLPYAVMNPSSKSQHRDTIQQHDRNNLRVKWN